MSTEDRTRWDDRYRQSIASGSTNLVRCPASFCDYEHLFPSSGASLEIACGRGAGSVWLAERGLEVLGVDVSPVAIETATALADAHKVADRCDFEVFDLERTLPRESQYDLIMCHMFRARSLDDPIVESLKPGGLLAIAVLSEVGRTSRTTGRFRETAGALLRRFDVLDVLAQFEGDGRSTLLAQKS